MFTDLKEDEYSQFSGRTKHLMKYFLCKLRNYFSTIHGFYQSRADPSFLDAREQKVFGWEASGPHLRGQCLITLFVMDWQQQLRYFGRQLSKICETNCIYWFIQSTMHCKSLYLVISKSIFSSSPVYLFYLSPLCCAEAVSGLHLYIATLLLLLRGNVLIQGYNVFTSTQMI